MLWWRRKEKTEDRYWEEGNLSFVGAGHLCSYLFGCAIAFKEYAPHIAKRKTLGASSGTLVAAALAVNVDILTLVNFTAKFCEYIGTFPLGAFSPRCDALTVLHRFMDEIGPEDSHKTCNGKLYVSLTRLPLMRNVLQCEFKSLDKLKKMIVASCYLPILHGLWPPKIDGKFYIDGGFTNGWPVLNDSTIHVSAFIGLGLLCPERGTAFFTFFAAVRNLVRCWDAVVSPSIQKQERYTRDGYRDACRFIIEYDLYACERCACLPHRPTRGDCKDCEALFGLLYKAEMQPSHCEPFREAKEARAALVAANPFQYSLFMRILYVLLALVLFPFELGVITTKKIYRRCKDISHLVKKQNE